MKSLSIVSALIFILFNLSSMAQDRIEINDDFKFKDGVYLSFEDFKNNTPSIPADSVQGFERLDESYEYIPKLKLKYQNKDGLKTKIKSSEIWGLSINGEVYIQHSSDGSSFRVKTIGAICLFSDIQTKTRYIGKGGGSGARGYYSSTFMHKGKPKFLQLETGGIFSYSVGSIEHLIAKDKALFAQYEGELFKDEHILKYLKLFNQRNPVYLNSKVLKIDSDPRK